MENTPIHDNLNTPQTPRKLTKERREWIYNIAIAVAAILTAYTGITTEQTELWLDLIAVVLGIGTTGALIVARGNIGEKGVK